MSDQIEDKLRFKKLTVVIQILSLVIGTIIAPNFANAWEWPWASKGKSAVPALPLENLLATDPTTRDRLFSGLQASMQRENEGYLVHLDQCEGFDEIDHNFIVRDLPFVIFETPSFGLDVIAEVLRGAGIIDQTTPSRSEKQPIYKQRNLLLFKQLDLRVNIPTGLLLQGQGREIEVKPEMLEIFEKLTGAMTMTGDVDSFQTSSGYNPYTGQSADKDGEIDVHTFNALIDGHSIELYALVKNKDDGQIEKVEIRLERHGGISAYLAVYRAFQQASILPKKYINPYKQEESAVLSKLSSETRPSIIESVHRKDVEDFLNSDDDAILIAPDHHDSPASMAFTLNLLQDDRIKGVGVEISESGQRAFDELNHPGELFSLTGVLKEIDSKWNFRRKWSVDISALEEGDQRKFKKASDMELIHAVTAIRQKPVIFMDAELPYLDARSICGQKLAHMTRNKVWANKIPGSGKFIVLGGSAHFAQSQAVNFQDFFAEKYPGRKIFMLEY